MGIFKHLYYFLTHFCTYLNEIKIGHMSRDHLSRVVCWCQCTRCEITQITAEIWPGIVTCFLRDAGFISVFNKSVRIVLLVAKWDSILSVQCVSSALWTHCVSSLKGMILLLMEHWIWFYTMTGQTADAVKSKLYRPGVCAGFWRL